ncbi:MAG: superoxide dismutase family protein [Bacillota bacterium]|nr:superoxide dismutase family protein [Bacillota bacterium]
MYENGVYAEIKGGKNYPYIHGTVTFRQETRGVLVTAEINGLPRKECGIFAFHIHSGGSCTGNAEDEFADAQGHYNPDNKPHPCHAGDLPPLFSNNGYAYMQVLTDRFSVGEIVGKTIIIHSGTDDFKTQPSGDSGNKIACGVIERV